MFVEISAALAAMLAQIGQSTGFSAIHSTITGAEDWPAFKFMFVIVIGLVGSLHATNIGIAIYSWQDIKKRISSERKEDSDKCNDCRRELIAKIED